MHIDVMHRHMKRCDRVTIHLPKWYHELNFTGHVSSYNGQINKFNDSKQHLVFLTAMQQKQRTFYLTKTREILCLPKPPNEGCIMVMEPKGCDLTHSKKLFRN